MQQYDSNGVSEERCISEAIKAPERKNTLGQDEDPNYGNDNGCLAGDLGSTMNKQIDERKMEIGSNIRSSFGFCDNGEHFESHPNQANRLKSMSNSISDVYQIPSNNDYYSDRDNYRGNHYSLPLNYYSSSNRHGISGSLHDSGASAYGDPFPPSRYLKKRELPRLSPHFRNSSPADLSRCPEYFSDVVSMPNKPSPEMRYSPVGVEGDRRNSRFSTNQIYPDPPASLPGPDPGDSRPYSPHTAMHLDAYRPEEAFEPDAYRNPVYYDPGRRYGRRYDANSLYLLYGDDTRPIDPPFRQISAPNLVRYSEGEEFYKSQKPIQHYSASFIPFPQEISQNGIEVSESGDREDYSAHSRIPEGEIPLRHSVLKKEPGRMKPPGENNPDAYPGANLCFDYMNKGRCERQNHGGQCHFRHLDADHPDAIADRFKNGLLSSDEIARFGLRRCGLHEVNPFAPEDAKICFEFLNKHTCSRTMAKKICRFRHLEAEHPDAIADREKSAKRKKE